MGAESLLLAIGTALWLGVLTSISPCPLATNIAAIAFVSRSVTSPRRALAGGLLYTLGRSVAYILIAAVAVFAFGRLLALSTFLQGTFYQLLGPLMIAIGMVLVGLIKLKVPTRSPVPDENRIRRGGTWAAFPLGGLFALSFCPVSAAIFFGMLIPMATRHHSVLMLPAVYGAATGLPVALFAAAIAFGASHIGAAYRAASTLERYARPATGLVLILIGIYETLRGVFHIL